MATRKTGQAGHTWRRPAVGLRTLCAAGRLRPGGLRAALFALAALLLATPFVSDAAAQGLGVNNDEYWTGKVTAGTGSATTQGITITQTGYDRGGVGSLNNKTFTFGQLYIEPLAKQLRRAAFLPE